MKTEQDKPVDLSQIAQTLIEEFMSAEQLLVFGDSASGDKKKKEERLENAKHAVGQTIVGLGSKGFFVFFRELEKLEQEADKQYNSNVGNYCSAGQADPNLGDFYDNEVNASFILLKRNLDSINSVKSFLQKLQAPQITPLTTVISEIKK